MYQYDTAALAQGYPHPKTSISAKKEVEKGHNSHIIL